MWVISWCQCFVVPVFCGASVSWCQCFVVTQPLGIGAPVGRTCRVRPCIKCPQTQYLHRQASSLCSGLTRRITNSSQGDRLLQSRLMYVYTLRTNWAVCRVHRKKSDFAFLQGKSGIFVELCLPSGSPKGATGVVGPAGNYHAIGITVTVTG